MGKSFSVIMKKKSYYNPWNLCFSVQHQKKKKRKKEASKHV